MNHIKRIGVLLLVLSLLLGTSVHAMAATGSITVENPVAEKEYAAYRIFDVTYNESQSAYTYTIAETSEWFDVVSDYAGITLTKAIDETNGVIYVANQNDGYSAADFAAVLSGNTAGKTGTPLTVANGKATATGLALGYYFVTSTAGALCNLTTTNPAASIYDKNDVPFEKTDDKQSVGVGDVVTYTLTGKVPSTTGFSSYTYELADTMSTGLTFQNDVEVFVGAAVLDEKFYTLTPHTTGDGFTLSIDVMALQNLVTQEIKVTYTAVVNENAVASIEKNAATLTYSNNPSDDTSTTTKPDEEKVYSSKLIIDKFAMSGTDKLPLQDAKFVLKNAEGKFYKYLEAVIDDPETEADESAAAKVDWVTAQGDATVIITDAEGYAEFKGLADGSYALLEIEAPAGYNPLTKECPITIAGSDSDETLLVQKAEVENQSGTELPETGGVGTALFYLVGGALVAGAFIVFVTRKRINTEK